MLARLLLALFCLTAWHAPAATLPAEVLTALQSARIPTASVAIVVQPVDASSPLLEHNAGVPMNPASVMKLLTTYAALDLLGPAYQWRTEALTDGELTSDGTLTGSLYLRGSGDPRFAIEHLTALLRQLRVRGVRHLARGIVLDRSAFEVPPFDPGAFDDKPMRPYNVGPDALLINFRTLRFTLAPANSGVRLLVETPDEGLQIENALQLTRGECGSDWKDRLAPRLSADSSQLSFQGSYAAACGERSLYLAPLGADAQAGGLIRALWNELGGTAGSPGAFGVRAGRTPAGATLLAAQDSAALAELVRDINKFSNNVMARQVFLSLSPERPATAERARQRVTEWLQSRGLRFDELVIDNGSGLSRSERISAGSLNRLLLDAWFSPVMPELVASLPIVGFDGTMKKRLQDTVASGRAHIKTGTLEGVRAAAGYALDVRGRRVAVSFLVSHPNAQAAQPAIDALLLWVARQP